MTSSQSTNSRARFLHGSTMGHVVRMTLTTALGLIAVFSVDFVDLFFLSQLENKTIQAALGFTGTILFFTISVGIGLAIAASAIVSRAAGEQDSTKVNRLTVNSLIYSSIIASAMALILFITIPQILGGLGAKGETYALSLSYLLILVPTMPIFALAIAASACLRSIGDAMRAMYVTFAGAIVNAVLDPLFIFTFDMGMDGAALATAIARFAMAAIGLYGLFKVHRCWCIPSKQEMKDDIRPFTKIAVPAILTNIATPISNGYVTYAAAAYGNSVVAAWAVIARLVPVAFAVLFALSGAVGPIIGQNLGGKQYARVRQTVSDALTFNSAYILFIWIVLALSYPLINDILQLEGITADLVGYFCLWLTPGFGLIGYLFVANAVFNNLDKPHYSTWLNWIRATLGTVPFVIIGAYLYGAHGLFTGHIIGGAITAFIAVYICYDLVDKIRINGEQTANYQQSNASNLK